MINVNGLKAIEVVAMLGYWRGAGERISLG